MKHEGHEDAIALWISMMQAQGNLTARVSARLEQQAGIPLAFHEVLTRLAFSPDGRMRMQELADSMMLSKSGLTRLCDRLEAGGYVERRACSEDRRGVRAVLTDAGRAKFDESWPVFLHAIEDMLAGPLSERDRASFRRTLGKLIGVEGGHLCWSVPAKTRA